jgi:glycosyltransferase involved in cell wall biosynthesis
MSLLQTAHKKMLTVAVIWARFGPYHLARLEAACNLLAEYDATLYGIEVSGRAGTYAWKPAGGAESFERITLFERKSYHDLDSRQIARATKEVLDRLSSDAVATPGWAFPEARAALAWCRANRRAAIAMTDSKEDDAPRRWWKEWLKSRIVRRFDAALVAGTPQASYLVKLGMKPERIFHGYDAVDNDYFAKRAERAREQADEVRDKLHLPEKYFLTSCRFIPEKNLFRLLDAYAAYRGATDNPWNLVVCGDGELAEPLRRHQKELKVNGVHWPGFVQIDELPDYYGLASGFILSSKKDTWGLAVNEAMASRLPVLVSERVGCRYDLVEDGANGFLFDPFDVGDMAQAMKRMASLPDAERQRMGQRSCEIIADWGPDRFAEGLWNAISKTNDSAPHLSFADTVLLRIMCHPRLCSMKKS